MVLLTTVLAAPALTRGADKPVLVHYMPWFAAKPYSSHWGWHWTMNRYNPEMINRGGWRQIASHYQPQIGPYDNADPVVLEYQVLLMKLAGIDGVIIDWYGMDDVHDFGVNEKRTLAMRDYAGKAGLKFCLCYEDRTIQAAIDAGAIQAADAVSHAQQTLLYAQSRYLTDPHYFRITNGQPLLLNFGPQYFKDNAQWEEIFSVLDPTNRPAFFTEDRRLSAAAGAFNWPPMQLSRTNGGVLSPKALERYLDEFERRGSRWPAYISSAFPRFDDIYQQAGVGESYGHLSDDGGATFRSTLARALTNKSLLVQLVTWNDYGEGTIIEPTAEYGYRDLIVLQEYRRRYLDPGFTYRASDLQLAKRIYHLRREYGSNLVLSAELDRVFGNIVAGDLRLAALRLNGIESRHAVIYEADWRDGWLRFSVGGYLTQAGTVVEATSNPSSSWQIAGPLESKTNVLVFSRPVAPGLDATFFRVRALPP